MNVKRSAFEKDIKDDSTVDVIDVKCNPADILMLSEQKGFYPGYHMSHKDWLSVYLDGSVDEKMIYKLIDDSYKLTD